jgi:hypothetical protein
LYQFINKDSMKSLKFSLSVFFFYVIIGTYGNKCFSR